MISPTCLHGWSILIVEDTRDIQTLRSRIVRQAGATAAVADTREAALQIVATQRIDCILLDIL